MIGTSTSQLQFTGIHVLTTGVATALLTAQPALAETLVSLDHPPLRSESVVKAEGRQWISSQLKRIEALPKDWDGYGADPIDTRVARAMKINLEQLLSHSSLPGSIVPGADGSLQAEWHLDRASFGLLIESDGTMSCWVQPTNTPEIESFGLEATVLFQSAVLTYLS